MLIRLLIAAVYLGVPAVPIAFVIFGNLPDRLLGRPVMDDIASMIAMIGFSIICLEFLVIGRYRQLSSRFGCDAIMRTHQLFARTATVFVIGHPFLYSLWGVAAQAGGALSNHEKSASTLGIGGWSLLSGGIAWIVLIALIASAARRHEPNTNYDRWRFWHAVAALLILVFGLHHTLDAGLYASLLPAQYFWWCLFIAALGSFATIYLIRPILQRGSAYRVETVVKHADDTYGLTLVPQSRQLDPPQPGQFFWIKRGSPLSHTDHPFSVAGFEPATGAITFLIKAVGDFTREIPSLKPGEHFYLDGPHGDFGPPDDARAVVMIAGGIGCAPFLSMVQRLAGSDKKVLLITATKTVSEQLEALPRYPGSPNVVGTNISWARVVEHSTAEWAGDVGRCDSEIVTTNLKRYGISPTDQGTYFLLCGPGPMMSTLEADLVEIGVNLRNIDSERYQYDLNPSSPITRRHLGRWLGLSAGMLLLAILAATF